MKDKDMTYMRTQRETVLTRVPADERMVIYRTVKDGARKDLISTLAIGTVIIAGYWILNMAFGKSEFFYGVLVGSGINFLGFAVIVYQHLCTLWKAPTPEEMDRLGGRII